MEPSRHLTLEALEALRVCREIWTNVPARVFERLAADLPPVCALKPFYKADRPRRQNYEDVTRHILDRGLVLGTVAYLTQGHPMIFDSVASNLLRDGSARGIAIQLVGGVSSIDTVLLDVRYDPSGGLQIFEASNFVYGRIKIDPRGALLLFQPSVLGSGMPRLTVDAPHPDLAPLRDALLAFYPPEHLATFVRSATSFNPPLSVSTEIRAIDAVAPSITLASSLFIPPLRYGGPPSRRGAWGPG